MTTNLFRAVLILTLYAGAWAHGATIGTAFTYQGDLYDNDQPVTDTCDFEFTLWGADTGGNQVGGVVAQSLGVDAGKFTTLLDFGSIAFAGEARWLQIDVCCPSPCSPALTPLDPRQELTPVPYAMHADGGGSADGHSLDASDGDPVDAVFVDAEGRIGIGTTTPDAQLHLAQGEIWIGGTNTIGGLPTSAGAGIRLYNSQNDGTARVFAYDYATNTPRDISLQNPGGRVGIGTTTPTEVLDVAGNIHASGTIASGNSITIDGANDTITASGGLIGFDDENLQTSGLIESTGAGFKFPDGTTQTSAATLPSSIDADTLNGKTAEELLDLAAEGAVLSPQYIPVAELDFVGLTVDPANTYLHGPSVSIVTEQVEDPDCQFIPCSVSTVTHYGNVILKQYVDPNTVSPLMQWHRDLVEGQLVKRDANIRLSTASGDEFWIHLTNAWPARATREYVSEVTNPTQGGIAVPPPIPQLLETYEFAVEGISFSGTERAEPPAALVDVELVGIGTVSVEQQLPLGSTIDIVESSPSPSSPIEKNPSALSTDALTIRGALPTAFLTILWPQQQTNIVNAQVTFDIAVRDKSPDAFPLWNYVDCWIAETRGLSVADGCPTRGCSNGVGTPTIGVDSIKIVCDRWNLP